MSKFASANFTVTNAMACVLKQKFGISAIPLHDRPAGHFKPLANEEKISFLKTLPETAGQARNFRLGTARLVVSSTSWTPDEDFGIFLDALVRYAQEAVEKRDLPELFVIITGKGPLKQDYMSQVETLRERRYLDKVQIKSAWLSPKDYASLLGAADIGVSLHTSSSGVDLPMKVVDMFGAGLPVVGWSKFEAWPELIREGVNGMGFESSEQLTDLLVDLFGSDTMQLERLREGALEESKRRWSDEWDPIAGKLFGVT